MPTNEATGLSPPCKYTTPRPRAGASKRRCHHCDGLLTQIPRRLVDRALSVFIPIHRYRCPNFLCVFEGNLRDRPLGTREVLNSFGFSSAIGHDRR